VNQAPRSWAASILSISFAVLAASAALKWAAQLLREALPVLFPIAIVGLLAVGGWRLHRRHFDNW